MVASNRIILYKIMFGRYGILISAVDVISWKFPYILPAYVVSIVDVSRVQFVVRETTKGVL